MGCGGGRGGKGKLCPSRGGVGVCVLVVVVLAVVLVCVVVWVGGRAGKRVCGWVIAWVGGCCEGGEGGVGWGRWLGGVSTLA